MRYHGLACDYDGTVAFDGHMDEATVDALRRVRETGRKLLLVTGRELPDLLEIVPDPTLFDRIVAENGALLYRPASREERPLAEPPPESFLVELGRRGVEPLSVGRVIVSTREPNQTAVLDAIRHLGLERQVIFNKGAVMVLPSGVNKATGLDAALDELGLSAHNCVAIGDAENDHAFLGRAECAVAVDNALPALKAVADLVTTGDHGRGARELIEALVTTDLADLAPRLRRHEIALGLRADGTPASWPPYGRNLLVTGASGSGKSTFATGVFERLSERGYQYCIIDPEGDYIALPGAVVLGDAERSPTAAEMLDVLRKPGHNVVVNLLGVALDKRPEFFSAALARLQELRVDTGRPHFLVADEAHHLMPGSWSGAPLAGPETIAGMVLITVHPDRVAVPMLSAVHAIVAVGPAPAPVVEAFARTADRPMPALPATPVGADEVLFWAVTEGDEVERLRTIPSRSERRRHVRKYSEGELEESRSFYFRGPDDRLNLRAQNLALFLQLGEGVDDETWLHHLRRGEYSRWFREAIKDGDLAAEVAAVEQRADVSAGDSRALVREAIARRYTV